MSTDEVKEAVRDAIAGAEIGEASPAMIAKRPWTEGMSLLQFRDEWYVVDPEERAVAQIVSANSEADARLFAAADGLYDMLQDYVCQHGCDCGHPSCSECKRTREARAKLRAANPAAFDGEGE